MLVLVHLSVLNDFSIGVCVQHGHPSMAVDAEPSPATFDIQSRYDAVAFGTLFPKVMDCRCSSGSRQKFIAII